MVKTITIKIYISDLNFYWRKVHVHQQGFLYKSVQDLKRLREGNSKGPKTIDLTGGMAFLGHSLPSTKTFGVKPIFLSNSTL